MPAHRSLAYHFLYYYCIVAVASISELSHSICGNNTTCFGLLPSDTNNSKHHIPYSSFNLSLHIPLQPIHISRQLCQCLHKNLRLHEWRITLITRWIVWIPERHIHIRRAYVSGTGELATVPWVARYGAEEV